MSISYFDVLFRSLRGFGFLAELGLMVGISLLLMLLILAYYYYGQIWDLSFFLGDKVLEKAIQADKFFCKLAYDKIWIFTWSRVGLLILAVKCLTMVLLSIPE